MISPMGISRSHIQPSGGKGAKSAWGQKVVRGGRRGKKNETGTFVQEKSEIVRERGGSQITNANCD